MIRKQPPPPLSQRQPVSLHERAKGAHTRDGTRYGLSNIATKSFRRHHTQRISFAVVSQDAINIARNVGYGKLQPLVVSAH